MSAPGGSTWGIERRGKDMLRPLLTIMARGAQLTDTNDLPNREQMQRTYGDYVFERHGETVGIEVKVEQRWTGNLFAETFSNATIRAEYFRFGWLATLSAAGLVYGFLDRRCAVVCNLPAFRVWFERCEVRYPLLEVGRSRNGEQRNRTLGCAVPVADFACEQWCQLWHERDGWHRCTLAEIEFPNN